MTGCPSWPAPPTTPCPASEVLRGEHNRIIRVRLCYRNNIIFHSQVRFRLALTLLHVPAQRLGVYLPNTNEDALGVHKEPAYLLAPHTDTNASTVI